jgi:hypothetical protein
MKKPLLTKREFFVLELTKSMKWNDGTTSYQTDKVISFVDELLKKLDKDKEQDSE